MQYNSLNSDWFSTSGTNVLEIYLEILVSNRAVEVGFSHFGLFSSLISLIYLIEAKPHQDIY